MSTSSRVIVLFVVFTALILPEAAHEVGTIASKSQTSTLKVAEVSAGGVQIGFLSGFAEKPIVKSFAKMTDALGVNDMPGLGTSFSSLKFSHMPSWDKYEVLWLNARALLLLAWPAPALLPLSIPPWSGSLPFIGSSSPLETSWKSIASLLVGGLQLFDKTGLVLKIGGPFLEGQSFAAKGVVLFNVMAVIGTIVVVKGLVKRTGQLEAALAASQADVQNISHLHVQQKHQNSATKASVKTAAKQHKKLTKQHASLKKALGRSDRQKAALQQKAVQLKQLLSALMVMSGSMQHANSNIVGEMQLLRSELGKLQDQLAALHRHTDSPQIKAADREAAKVAADGTSIKQPFKQVNAGSFPMSRKGDELTLEEDEEDGSWGLSELSQLVHPNAQASPRIAAGRLRDHRGDYFSESPLLVDNPYSPSFFSGSFSSSFSPGLRRNKGAGNTCGHSISLLATPLAFDPVTTNTHQAQKDEHKTSKTRKTSLVKAGSKLGRLLNRLKHGS